MCSGARDSLNPPATPNAESTISVIRMFQIDEMQVIAAVSLDVRQRRAEMRPMVGTRVKNLEACIFHLNEGAHHERQCVECRPRADVVWLVVNVHLRRVDLQRHLANAVDKSRSNKVVQCRPLRKLNVQLDEVQCSLQSQKETYQFK